MHGAQLPGGGERGYERAEEESGVAPEQNTNREEHLERKKKEVGKRQ